MHVALLTVFRLQVTMKNHDLSFLRTDGSSIRSTTDSILTSIWRVFSIVAAKECQSDLRQDTPNERFFDWLTTSLVVIDDTAKVTIAAVLHVDVKTLDVFLVVSLVVGNDILMTKVFENVEFGRELLALFVAHAPVRDFLSTEDLRGQSVK